MAPWPLPWEFHHGSSILHFSKDVPLVYRSTTSDENPASWLWEILDHVKYDSEKPSETDDNASDFTEELVRAAYERIKSDIISKNFVPRKFYKGIPFEPNGEAKIYVKNITVQENRISDHERSDEAYSLEISKEGDTLIRSVSYHGTLLALRSLQQLFYSHSEPHEDPYTPYAPLSIKDCPVFSHRGLHIDISRNQIFPGDVLPTIEALSLNKFNRLHLHATDSQSWPLEVAALPELATKGAYDKRQVWSVADLQEVQTFGFLRGVEVYVEIDLPSHAAAIHHAYPDLITGYNAQPWDRYALEPPAGQLKLNSPAVTTFMTALLNDVVSRTSFSSSHFHFGGDELNREVYTLDPTVKSSSPDVIRPFLQKFFDHAISLAEPYKQTPIVYEDVLLEWELNFPKTTIFQSWKSHSSLLDILARGHRALFGPCTHWYLDQGYGSWLDPDPENPDTPVKPPYLDWAAPYKNWRQIYSYDPLANVPEEQKHLIAGGEACLWGELTDSVNLEQKLWPRTAAAGEILWKGPMKVEEATTRRLAEMRERLVAMGMRAEMVQMEWSLRNEGCSRF